MAESGARTQQSTREMPPLMGRGGPPMARLMGKPEPAKDVRGTLLRLWGYLRRQRLALIVTAAIVVVNTGLAVSGPYLLGVAIDDALTPGDLAKLAQVGLLMLGVYALNAFFTWLQAYIMAGAAQRTVRERDEKVRTMEEAWQRQRRNAELFASQGNQRRTPGIVTGEPPAQTNGQK